MLSELDARKCAFYWPNLNKTLQFPQDNSGHEVRVTNKSEKTVTAWYVMVWYGMVFYSHKYNHTFHILIIPIID